MDGELTYDRRSGWTIFELELPSSEHPADVSRLDEPTSEETVSTAAEQDVDLLAPPVRG
jgi:hypothetical protein